MRYRRIQLLGFALILLGTFVISGCATVPSGSEAKVAYVESNDPLEPLNRVIWKFNLVIDKAILRPIAAVYKSILPELVRDGVKNVLSNLRSPVILTNDILQGELGRAGSTAGRFVLNSTAGIGGIFDVATSLGLEAHDEDFGQTLAVWGVGEGPYLMLPVLGPSNSRDALGLVGEYFADPIDLWANNTSREWILYTRKGLNSVDSRSRNVELLEELERTSIDFYAAVRSLYRQQRMDKVRNGEVSGPVGLPSVTLNLGIKPDTLSSLE